MGCMDGRMESGRMERKEVGGWEVRCQAVWEFEGMFKSCVCQWPCVCVCLLSVWVSKHGTKWWLTWRQSSWQQRMSSCSITSQLSQNPTDLSPLSVSLCFLNAVVFFCSLSSFPLCSLVCRALYPSTSCPISLHSLIPSSPSPTHSLIITDINRGNTLQWSCHGVYLCVLCMCV